MGIFSLLLAFQIIKKIIIWTLKTTPKVSPTITSFFKRWDDFSYENKFQSPKKLN
jgi:hypothetical protein